MNAIPFLTTILARVMAMTDYVLNTWASVEAAPVDLINAGDCTYGIQVLDASVNGCGEQFLGQVIGLINQSVALANALIMGAFAV